jgi:hypothetical protein
MFGFGCRFLFSGVCAEYHVAIRRHQANRIFLPESGADFSLRVSQGGFPF